MIELINKFYRKIFLFLLLVYLSNPNLFAQWSKSYGLVDENVFSLERSGNDIYVGYSFGGIFKTSNSGITWSPMHRRLDGDGNWPQIGWGLVIKDSIIMVGTFGQGVFCSTNMGYSWNACNNGIIQKEIRNVITAGNNFIAGGWLALYISSNNGLSWNPITNGIPSNFDIISLYSNGNKLYAGVLIDGPYPNGIYYSSNYGDNWIFIGPTAEPSSWYYAVFADSNYVIAGANNLYKTTNNGNYWSIINNGIEGLSVRKIYKYNQYLFAGTRTQSDNTGVYRSSNLGYNWIFTNSGIPTRSPISDFINDNNYLYAGLFSNHGDVYKSSNFGLNWIKADLNLFKDVTSLASKDMNIYASIYGLGVFTCKRNYATWTTINRDNLCPYVRKLLISGNDLYAGCDSNGVYKTTNNGDTWTEINNGITNLSIKALCCNNNFIFAGSNGSGVFRTSNGGLNWTNVVSGLIRPYIRTLSSLNNNIFAGTDSGIYISTNDGLNWNSLNNGLTNLIINSINFQGSFLYAGTNNGLFRSSNNGLNWIPKNSGMTCSIINSIEFCDSTMILAGTEGCGVYISNNNGELWYKKNSEIDSAKIKSLHTVNSNMIFAGTNKTSIYFGYTNALLIRKISNTTPSGYKLYQNYPNPFNPVTKIKFDIPPLTPPLVKVGRDAVTLKVFDILGKEVATLVNEQLAPGTYEVTFDVGKFASGVYFYKLSARDPENSGQVFSDTKRMLLIK